MTGSNGRKVMRRGALLRSGALCLSIALMSILLMGQGCPVSIVDTDGDGISDAADNCPTVANADQADADNDGAGDACDTCPNDADDDADGDSVCGDVDNCPSTANADQADTDGDGTGDACDDTPNGDLSVTAAASSATATGGDDVTLTATRTNGVAPVSFAWELTASGTAGSVTLANAATQTATATFSDDAEGSFTFQVTATDSLGATAMATTTVAATPADATADTTFTLNIDDLDGSDGDDDFLAPLALNNAGNSIPTLQTGDQADGGAGQDTLTAMFNSTADTTVLPLSLAGIEDLIVTDFTNGAFTTTLNLANAAAVESIALTNTTSVTAGDTTSFTNIANTIDIALSNVQSDSVFSFAAAATTGTTDTLDISVSQTTSTAQISATTANTNGFETVAIDSTGSTGNFLQDVVLNTGTSQRTMNVTGDQNLSILGQIDGNITTFNAGSATGGVFADLSTAVNMTATGGTGDDIFLFAGNYTTNDTINGGAGTDVLGLNSAQLAVAVNQTNVTNIEGLLSQEALANDFTAAYFGSITQLWLPAGFNTKTATVANGTNVLLGAVYRDNVALAANADTAAVGGITVQGLGTTDSVTVTVNDHDFGAANTLTLTGIETIALVSNMKGDNTAADDGVNKLGPVTAAPTAGTATLNLTGNEAVEFQAKLTGVGTFDGSSFTEAITMKLNTGGSTANANSMTTIKGGTGNDVLVGSTGGDIITSGGGNDRVQPGTGIDNVTLGTGACLLDLDDLNAAALTTANRVTVSGFTAAGTYSGSGDVDAIVVGNVTDDGDLSDGAVTAEFQVETTAGNKTLNGTAGIIELAWEFSSGVDLDNSTDGTQILAALGATTGTTAGTITVATADDAFILIAYQSGNAYLYYGDAGANTGVAAGEMALIGVFSGISVGDFDFSNFQ